MSILLLNEDEFTPKSIQGLKAWYDANPLDLTVDGSNYVSLWKDKSGNGNDLTQSTGLNQPLYSSNEVTFDGATDRMVTASITLPTTMQTYFVVKVLSGSNKWLFDGLVKYSMGLFLYSTNALRVYSPGAVNFFGSTITVGQYAILTVQFNGASSFVRINGGAKSTGSLAAINPTGIALGGTSDYGNFSTKNFLAYGSALTNSQDTLVLNYLSKKYGITL